MVSDDFTVSDSGEICVGDEVGGKMKIAGFTDFLNEQALQVIHIEVGFFLDLPANGLDKVFAILHFAGG